MSETYPGGVEIHGPITAEFAQILSPEAVAFVAKLCRRFEPRRQELLAARAARQKAFDAGKMPDFLPDTANIRNSDWKIAPQPADMLDRRVEITGPTDRKMVINALNCGASVFMADFEDADTPTWHNMIDGQINLRDAVRRNIALDQEGKKYKLNDKTAVLMARPRGWHLNEKHLLIDGKPFRLGFRGDKLERVDTASVRGEATATLHRVTRGHGVILWLPLPVELSDSAEAVASVYRTALAHAAVRPTVVVTPEDPGLFIGTTTFADAVLVVVASESSADMDVRVSLPPATGGTTATGQVAPGTAVHLQAGRARLLLLDRKSGRVVGMDGEGEGK